MWLRWVFLGLGVSLGCVLVAAHLGERRWHATSDQMVAAVRSRETSSSAAYSEADLAALPLAGRQGFEPTTPWCHTVTGRGDERGRVPCYT